MKLLLEWRIRKNEELKRWFQIPDIVEETKNKETPASRACMEKKRNSWVRGWFSVGSRKERYMCQSGVDCV